jgi:hypothetical protein
MAAQGSVEQARPDRVHPIERLPSAAGDRLASVGQYVTFSPGSNPNPNVERELQRWLGVHPHADAADGFRAGWARLARWVGPQFREMGSPLVSGDARKRSPEIAHRRTADATLAANG